MGNPLISVLIPTYNRTELLSETLDSVLNQTYQNWECVIVDDGSDDGTQDIIKKYLDADNRCRFFQRNREPKGAPVCRNIGIENSKGDYIIFLDSDDMLAVDCLENRTKIVEENHDFDFWVFQTSVFCKTPGDTQLFWNQLHKGKNDLYRFIVHDNPWATAASIWTKESIQKLNGFDEEALCWQDWELHIRALLKGIRYYKSSEFQYDNYYRLFLNGSNAIHDKNYTFEHLANNFLIINKLHALSLTSYIGLDYKNTFGIIYFRLLWLLYKENINNLKWNVFYKMLRNHIFTFKETILVFILLFRLKFESLENRKINKINKFLKKLNQEKFFNSDNLTYIFARINELPKY